MDYLIQIFNEPSNVNHLIKVVVVNELDDTSLPSLLPRKKIDGKEMWFLTRILIWADKYQLERKMFKIRNTDFVVSTELIEEIIDKGYYNEAEKQYLETLIPLYFKVVNPNLQVDEIKEEFEIA